MRAAISLAALLLAYGKRSRTKVVADDQECARQCAFAAAKVQWIDSRPNYEDCLFRVCGGHRVEVSP